MDEWEYVKGANDAWRQMLKICVRQLGLQDAEAARLAWIAERDKTINSLRKLCAQFDDAQWDEATPLDKIVEDHVFPHLQKPAE